MLDLTPELTQRTTGEPVATGASWRYDAERPRVGGNVRWGMSNNLTLNGTVNPDFSQIESDAGQVSYDPRQALFFAEKRPFFLDGSEFFATPKNLVYTRRIVQPVAAAKITGKMSGFSLGLLNAVDGTDGSLDGASHPVYSIARIQRDIGARGKLGLLLTDRDRGRAVQPRRLAGWTTRVRLDLQRAGAVRAELHASDADERQARARRSGTPC